MDIQECSKRPQVHVLALPPFLWYFVQKYFLGFAFQKIPSVGLLQALEQGLFPLVVLRSVQLQGQIIFEERFVCPGCCGWCGFCFVYWKVCFPALSVSSCLAQWRAWIWHLWCWTLQDLFSCFCDGRRPSRQWLWDLCMSCAFLFNVILHFKFPKHDAFSLSCGLLPLNSFLDVFCWKMVMSLWVDFCQNINLTYICSAENCLSYAMINKWAIRYGAETITLEVKKGKVENDSWAKKSIRELGSCCF